MPSLFTGEVDKRTFVARQVHEQILHVVFFGDERFGFIPKKVTP